MLAAVAALALGARVAAAPAGLAIAVDVPARSAEEVEIEVARPLEEALADLPGLERMESASREGGVVLTLTLERGGDLAAARGAVQSRLAATRARLPQDAGPPSVSALEAAAGPAFVCTLRSEAAAPDMLRAVCDRDVRPQLVATAGVARVVTAGGALRETEVRLDPAQLAARGVTVEDVLAALESNRLSAPGLQGGTSDPSLLGRVVVAARDGVPMLLGDVGVVRTGAAPGAAAAMRDGERCALVLVFLREGTPAAAAERALRERLAAVAARLPPSFRLEPLGPPLLAARAPGRLAGAGRAAFEKLREMQDVSSIVASETSQGEIEIFISLAARRERPFAAAAADVAERLARAAPGAAPWDLSSAEGSLAPALTLRLRGPDLETLRGLAAGIVERARAVPGVRAARVEGGALAPRLVLRSDQKALARAGISAADLARTVAAAQGGVVAGRATDGSDLVVRVSEDALGALALRSPAGDLVPVRALVAIETVAAPLEIRREDGERFLDVKIDAPEDARKRAALAAEAALPPGYRLIRR